MSNILKILGAGLLVLSMNACSTLTPPTALSTPQSQTAETAFENMKSLVGDWKRQDRPNSTRTIRMELTANDTVLVETWLRGDRAHSLTLYHMDNGKLLATHYCPQGNQPRLKMTAESDAEHIEFAFMDSTNLQSLDDNHQHSLNWDISNTELVTRGESYLGAEGEDVSSMVLTRVAD